MPDGDTPRTTWQIQDFSGGINQDISPIDLKPNECLEAHNVKFFRPTGCVSPRPGRRWMVGTTGTPMVQSTSTDAIGIYQYKTSAGTINPMIATYATSNLSASIGYLDANGKFAGLISTSLSPLHYGWTGAGRIEADWLSAYVHYPNSADYVCMTTYEDHIIATWAPSAKYTNAMPPIMWDGITASATVLHLSSEPQLGPEDDGSGTLFNFDGGTEASALAVGVTISCASGEEGTWGCNVLEGSYTGIAPNQLGYIRYNMLSGGPPSDDDAIVVAPYVCGGFSASLDGDPWATSADRLISVMIDLSAAYCGTFKGYLFFMDTVENEIISSDSSGAGLFSAMWHPYRVRWNNPAASSIRCVEESGGGAGWTYEDYADFDPRDGYGITGYGILGDKMLIFKKNKTYEISWVGGDEIFQYKKLSDKVGCVSHRSIVTTEGGAAWLADDGFYYFDGNMPQKVSNKIKKICAELNTDRDFLACGALWPELRQSYWSIPVNNSQENNLGILWDFSTGAPGAWSTTGISMGNLIGLNKVVVEQSAVGIWGTDYNGWAHMYDENITTETSGSQTDGTAVGAKASAGIGYSWKSGWMTFDDLEHIKRIKRIRSVLDRSTTTGHLSVVVRKNWEDDGIPDAISLRPLSGRSGLSGGQIYDKCDCTAMGQVLQLQYATSAGSAVDGDTVGISSHHWTLHDISLDYDTLGTVFTGDY